MGSASPLLAITMGDPAGIGPEIIIKAHRQPAIWSDCRPVVVGDRRILERASAWLPQPAPPIDTYASISQAQFDVGHVTLLDLDNAPPSECVVGVLNARAGHAAYQYITYACQLAMNGEVDAIVTAPINKEALHAAGHLYAGHTELLAELTNAKRVSMLLTGSDLRVVHVSTHVSLQEAIQLVRPERILEVIHLAHQACVALGVEQPKIAVAGLNPHAAEAGLFGHEEEAYIRPAIEAARQSGLDVYGPMPPDTVFLHARQGKYDIVVAMYHDQGHIPLKLLAFDSGVNISFGLPIIRTSVDHGTAFDIAGTGRANEASLVAAMKVAVAMVRARQRSSR